MSGDRSSGRKKVCMVMPDICESPEWSLLHVIFLVPRIQWRLPDFWKVCAPLALADTDRLSTAVTE